MVASIEARGSPPHHVDVAVLDADSEGDLGGAAEEDRDAAGLHGRDVGVGRLEVVELAVVVERGLAAQHAPHHVEVLAGAAVAGVVVAVVAVAALFGVAAAGDDVDGDAAAGEVVERGELAGGEGRRDEAGPVGDQELDPLRAGGGGLRHVQPVGRGRGVADQHLVEVRLLVGAGELAEVVAVDAAPDDARRRIPLRRLDPDHPDELDRHGDTSSAQTRRIAPPDQVFQRSNSGGRISISASAGIP